MICQLHLHVVYQSQFQLQLLNMWLYYQSILRHMMLAMHMW